MGGREAKGPMWRDRPIKTRDGGGTKEFFTSCASQRNTLSLESITITDRNMSVGGRQRQRAIRESRRALALDSTVERANGSLNGWYRPSVEPLFGVTYRAGAVELTSRTATLVAYGDELPPL